MRITSPRSKFGNIFGLYHYEIFNSFINIVPAFTVFEKSEFEKFIDFSQSAIPSALDDLRKTPDTQMAARQQFGT